MAEELGINAKAACVVQQSFDVLEICAVYSEVDQSDIKRLHDGIKSLHGTAKALQHVLDGSHTAVFERSPALLDSLDALSTQLTHLQKRLDPGTARKAMHFIKFRPLKLPLQSDDVNRIVTDLQRSEQMIREKLTPSIREKFDSSAQASTEKPVHTQSYSIIPFDRDPDFVDRPEVSTWIREKQSSNSSPIALVGWGGLGLVILLKLEAINYANRKEGNPISPCTSHTMSGTHPPKQVSSGCLRVREYNLGKATKQLPKSCNSLVETTQLTTFSDWSMTGFRTRKMARG